MNSSVERVQVCNIADKTITDLSITNETLLSYSTRSTKLESENSILHQMLTDNFSEKKREIKGSFMEKSAEKVESISVYKVYEALDSIKKSTTKTINRNYSLISVDETSFTCPHCNANLESQTSLDNHMFVSHIKKNKITNESTVETDLSSTIKIELQDMNTIKESLSCTSCKKKFDSVESVQCHMLSHSEVQVVEIDDCELECKVCKAQLPQNTLLLKHLTNHDTPVCGICGLKCDDVKERNHHISLNHIKGQFKCTICGRQFKRHCDIMQHMKMHTNSRTFKCKLCNARFSHNGLLLKHMWTGHGRKQFKCEVCQMTYTERRSLEKHVVTHTKEPFVCDICGRSFKSQKVRTRHMVVHSERPKEKRFKCDVCHTSFEDKFQLEQHTITHDLLICKVCGRQSKSLSILKKHMSQVHNKDKQMQCIECGKLFVRPQDLKVHMLQHRGERPFKCQECDAAFYRRSTLQSHILFCHSNERAFQCELCGLSFHRRSGLKNHMVVHSNEKPFKCDVCDSSFARADHLRVHFRIHSAVKPFKCTKCDASYNHNCSLKTHMLTHAE